MRAFPKPSESDGKVTLSKAERSKLLDDFCRDQQMLCRACEKRMTREPDRMNTATLGHRKCQPAGCAKDDRPENIVGALCSACNCSQGSQVFEVWLEKAKPWVRKW